MSQLVVFVLSMGHSAKWNKKKKRILKALAVRPLMVFRFQMENSFGLIF